MTDDRPTLQLDVEGAYDLWAAMYDDVPTSLVVGAEEVVAGFAKLVRGRDVIELGCGSGRNLANFAKQGAKSLSGIDASSKMLAKAVEVAKSASLAQGDYSKITPFAEQSADFVLFCLTLEHIENLGEPLLEAARLMRPGGYVGIVEIHPELASKGVKACFETPEALVEMPTFFHPVVDFEQAIGAADLKIIQQKTWRRQDFATPHPRMLRRPPVTPYLLEILAQKF